MPYIFQSVFKKIEHIKNIIKINFIEKFWCFQLFWKHCDFFQHWLQYIFMHPFTIDIFNYGTGGAGDIGKLLCLVDCNFSLTLRTQRVFVTVPGSTRPATMRVEQFHGHHEEPGTVRHEHCKGSVLFSAWPSLSNIHIKSEQCKAKHEFVLTNCLRGIVMVQE